MSAKRKQSSELDSPTGRLQWLRDNVWGGAQLEMAKETGVHQGSLSNILRGKREPGRVLLEKIARHPRINESWLFTGHGKPLVESAVAPEPGEAALFVARQPFVGLPSRNPASLKHYLLPVHRSLYRSSRYWVEIDQTHPLTANPSLRISPGDAVLFEPDPAGWPAQITGYPCIVRVGRGKKSNLLYSTQGINESILANEQQSAKALPQPREREERVITFDTGGGLPTKASVERTSKKLHVVAVGIYREGGFGQSL